MITPPLSNSRLTKVDSLVRAPSSEAHENFEKLQERLVPRSPGNTNSSTITSENVP